MTELRQRSRQTDTVAHDAAVHAAVAVPGRRRKGVSTTREVNAFLATFEAAPHHLKDNEYIKRGYRAGYNFSQSLKSLFYLHNETGNIYTHLIGFIIFIFLTVATVRLRPAPLQLGADALTKLESRLYEYGKHNLYDLLQTAESWEQHVVNYGHEAIATLEDKLRQIKHDNLQELESLRDSLLNMTSTLGQSVNLSDVGQKLKNYSRSGMAELHSMEERISTYGTETVRDLEALVYRALAGALDTTWPAKRWPIYVFLIGAMLCLLTSAVCHLFGCCAAHISSIIWRFDYAGIAVLIVASFFPPVYYAFLCEPSIRLFYLVVTSVLGLCTLTVTLMERFQAPDWAAFRAMLFIGLGSWGLVPVMHGWVLHWEVQEFGDAIKLQGVMGLLYLGGAMIYVAKIPERWKPGAFDLAFQSHQIFHVAVVLAALVHYKASNVLLSWRDATGGCMEY